MISPRMTTDLKDKCILTNVVCDYQPFQTHQGISQMKTGSFAPLASPINPKSIDLIYTAKIGLKCIHVFWSLSV